MKHVSHQTMIMQFIRELSKSFKVDPRECVRPFFARSDCLFYYKNKELKFHSE